VIVPRSERERLLELVRLALAAACGIAPASAVRRLLAAQAPIGRCGAAFVTLSAGDDLRGCMGVLDADRPLSSSVWRAATLAARSDPRFGPLRSDELAGLEVEVSVLGPMVELADPGDFELGVHGILVEHGAQRGLLLPEVGARPGWDRLGMLEVASRKAGLGRDGWRLPGTRVLAFRTCRFGGPAVLTSS
jgi:AmmeMemoRadiSam system protein A